MKSQHFARGCPPRLALALSVSAPHPDPTSLLNQYTCTVAHFPQKKCSLLEMLHYISAFLFSINSAWEKERHLPLPTLNLNSPFCSFSPACVTHNNNFIMQPIGNSSGEIFLNESNNYTFIPNGMSITIISPSHGPCLLTSIASPVNSFLRNVGLFWFPPQNYV